MSNKVWFITGTSRGFGPLRVRYVPMPNESSPWHRLSKFF